MSTLPFPPQLHVFVRDWLSANHIVLRSRAGHVLIDSGYHTHAPITLQLLQSRFGLGADPLALLVNTHCHSDHMGNNATLQAKYGCRIAVPEGEAPLIEAWDGDGLWLNYTGQHAPRFMYDTVIRAGETHVWGDLEWEALSAPGHDMGALAYYNRKHRLLIPGDALWQNGFGVVFPPEMNPGCLAATRATLELFAELDVAAVIPGHGEPFDDFRDALARARSRVAAFEADSQRMARHLLKVMLSYSLLDARRMRESDLPAYCETTPIYAEVNRIYFRLQPGALAQMLVKELERSRAVRRDGEWLVPA